MTISALWLDTGHAASFFGDLEEIQKAIDETQSRLRPNPKKKKKSFFCFLNL